MKAKKRKDYVTLKIHPDTFSSQKELPLDWTDGGVDNNTLKQPSRVFLVQNGDTKDSS